MEPIAINEKTVNKLKEINTAVMQLQAQATMLMDAYADALGFDLDDYNLSKDLTMLVPKKQQVE